MPSIRFFPLPPFCVFRKCPHLVIGPSFVEYKQYSRMNGQRDTTQIQNNTRNPRLAALPVARIAAVEAISTFEC